MRLSGVVVGIVAAGVVGCGGGSSGPTAPTSTTPTTSSITISGYADELTSIGQTVQLKATATMSNGSTQDVTSTATWASDATGVATVSGSGLLRAVSSGDATITATTNGVVGRQRITVSRPKDAQPEIYALLTVTQSPELAFMYRAQLEADFVEIGGGVGYSVNFIDIIWRDHGEEVMVNQHINPGHLQGIWGSNYVPAGGGQGILALIDYNRPLSHISAEVTISLSDDFGNQQTFSQTFRNSVGVTAPARSTTAATSAPARASDIVGR